MGLGLGLAAECAFIKRAPFLARPSRLGVSPCTGPSKPCFL